MHDSQVSCSICYNDKYIVEGRLGHLLSVECEEDGCVDNKFVDSYRI